MTVTRATTRSQTLSAPSAATSEFRLGEDQNSDGSDSDQSAHSERSLSPQSSAKKSKAKKRKDRKQVGALTDELDTLLGAAFQAPNGDSAKPDATAGDAEQIPGEVTMEVDTEKKLSKRTRQNLVKMEKRKLAKLQKQQCQFGVQRAAVEQKPLTPHGKQQQQKQSKKNSTQARRERKEKSRAKRAAGLGDEMAID